MPTPHLKGDPDGGEWRQNVGEEDESVRLERMPRLECNLYDQVRRLGPLQGWRGPGGHFRDVRKEIRNEHPCAVNSFPL